MGSERRESDPMLPTPSTSHVNTDRIYDPAEDSFLLLDTLSSKSETLFLQDRFILSAQIPSPLVVEVGVGSGVVLAFLTAHAQALLSRTDILSLGVDVNEYACQATAKTVEIACNEGYTKQGVLKSGLFLTAPVADLLSVIRPRTVDILVFNPPYVPTSEVPGSPDSALAAHNGESGRGKYKVFDEDSRLLSLSYAGGVDGMEVTNRLLSQLPSVLSAERGVAYILLCQQNKPAEVMQRVRSWGAGWAVDVLGRSGKQGGWEKLQVLRVSRQCHDFW